MDLLLGHSTLIPTLTDKILLRILHVLAYGWSQAVLFLLKKADCKPFQGLTNRRYLPSHDHQLLQDKGHYD